MKENKKNIVGIIPARGGSVGVPLKNIRPLAGKPLIAYTIEVALKSQMLDRVIVSTDHDETAKISKEYGASVPFKRPASISEDVETELVLQHAVAWLEKNDDYSPDIIVLLQPTQPMRIVDDIDNTVKKLVETGADSVCTVTDIEGHRPEWMCYLDNETGKITPYNTPFVDDGVPIIKLVARQDFHKLYKLNAVVYAATRKLLMEKGQMVGKNSYGIPIPEERALDIDTMTDLLILEAFINIKNAEK